MRRIVLPSALPSMLTGLRLGLGYSWRSLIGAELLAAASGLGYLIHDAEALSRPDVIVAGVLVLGVIGGPVGPSVLPSRRPGHPLAAPGRSPGWMGLGWRGSIGSSPWREGRSEPWRICP